jgi:cytochrome c peroxidase
MHETSAGRFKAPTLRNIALTAPYMHDGSLATLEAVIEHHAEGAATLTAGATQDLVAFLDSLTDNAVTTDPRFSRP